MQKLQKLVTPKGTQDSSPVETKGIVTPQEFLKGLVKRYALNKNEYDSYKKLVDADNKQIKKIMLEQNIDTMECDNVVATVSVSERTSFNEDMLLDIVKKTKLKGIVKKKEYVDADALENAIFNGDIDAAILQPAQVTSEVVTLKVKYK